MDCAGRVVWYTAYYYSISCPVSTSNSHRWNCFYILSRRTISYWPLVGQDCVAHCISPWVVEAVRRKGSYWCKSQGYSNRVCIYCIIVFLLVMFDNCYPSTLSNPISRLQSGCSFWKYRINRVLIPICCIRYTKQFTWLWIKEDTDNNHCKEICIMYDSYCIGCWFCGVHFYPSHLELTEKSTRTFFKMLIFSTVPQLLNSCFNISRIFGFVLSNLHLGPDKSDTQQHATYATAYAMGSEHTLKNWIDEQSFHNNLQWDLLLKDMCRH